MKAKKKTVEPGGPLRGGISPPPDKSISHRAVILASIAEGKSRIENLLLAADTISTLRAMEALGVKAKGDGKEINAGSRKYFENYVIDGAGLYGLSEPAGVIDCGNSGTTMRLLCGLLSGNPFFSVLSGDESLNRRPMKRVIGPLTRMGARIIARGADGRPPIEISGGGLKGIRYEMPVASAQVKSALMLASLYAEGKTVIKEPYPSRDHTERMLTALGVNIGDEYNDAGEHIIMVEKPSRGLKPFEITIPGDFSSAAFFIVGALITDGSDLLIKNVCLNHTRTGLLDALRTMGAKIDVENPHLISGEPAGDLRVKGPQELKAVNITGPEIPLMIDELPILCIAAASASGRSVIRGAAELRVKESDRIRAMAAGLAAMGVEVEEFADGLAITGGKMRGARVDSFGDHRVAMAFSIAALAASGVTEIEGGEEAVKISYPEFFDRLDSLRGLKDGV